MSYSYWSHWLHENNHSELLALVPYHLHCVFNMVYSTCLRTVAGLLYLTARILKFPVLKFSCWSSALASPKPKVRTERIKVRSLPKTKRTAHSENLEIKTPQTLNQLSIQNTCTNNPNAYLSPCKFVWNLRTYLNTWFYTCLKCILYYVMRTDLNSMESAFQHN